MSKFMAETKYKPIRHNHRAFLKKAKRRSGFQEVYRALAVEYKVASETLAYRAGTSKSNKPRLKKIDPLP
jgi:hypothetical protein